jgi:hypothetical protein
MNINFSALEIGLSNSCFLVLLLTTIYYWIKIIPIIIPQSQGLMLDI